MVPHKTVLGFDTTEAETLLKNRPSEQMVNPFNKEEFDKLMHVHNAEVESKMGFLFQHAPAVFDALYVKYKPDVQIQPSPEMVKTMQTLENDQVKFNTFSTYYNLTKLEMYNLMDGGAIFKTLFKTNKEGVPAVGQNAAQQNEPAKDNRYKAWVRVDFDNRRPDGSFEIKMFHENRNFNLRELFSNYNFKETNDRFSRGDVVKFLEKGSKILVTNLNDTGEKELLVRANPEYKDLDKFKLTGEPIRSPKDYLKNQLAVEVADVVSLKKAGDLQRNNDRVPMTAEKIQEKAAVFQSAKTIYSAGQKKTSPGAVGQGSSENKSSVAKEPRNSQADTVERRTRHTTRTLADSSAGQQIKR
jgi:hypothetical protein